jgi:hypothetical protein
LVGAVAPASYVMTTGIPGGVVVAVTTLGEPSKVAASPPSATVAAALLTTRDWPTLVAARWLSPPAWLAVISAVPAPMIVTVAPLTLATAGLELA